MRLNTASAGVAAIPRTHEGGHAARITPLEELRRSVMACLLWEQTFYEGGIAVADRIAALVPAVPPAEVAALAVEARSEMNLRHVPLLLCREMARAGKLRAETLAAVIQRPDEMAEFLAIYWAGGRCPLSKQVQKGLALAFPKFNAYQLAKYNRGGAVKLRDVLFLSHAKPRDAEQAEVWKRLIAGELEPPDTWEVALSGGADKREAWTRLLSERKIGALALLRNLRNMREAGVDRVLIRTALGEADVSRVLPFRFIAAARHAPDLEPDLEACMFRSLSESPKMAGHTAVVVDVSGSMRDQLSERSDMTRMDAACGVAMVARELCEDVAVYSFSQEVVEIAPRRGFALRDAIISSQPHGGTFLARALGAINGHGTYDRLIVVTDEQSGDGIAAPLAEARAYCINVASYQNGVGYGRRWTNISGFSESVVKYIQRVEH